MKSAPFVLTLWIAWAAVYIALPAFCAEEEILPPERTAPAPSPDGAGLSTKAAPEEWFDRFTLGGYGELHANLGEGGAPDLFDIHRLVLYMGYEFADWIRFHSETEVEHAFVQKSSGGELSLEQAHVDLLLTGPFNVRLGRFLTPVGITNRTHEPPTFNGVERPSFDKTLLPTTWSSDGFGVFGDLTPWWSYEAYVAGGLDGSKFDDRNGLRGGRIKERPSLQEPALMARMDLFPLAALGLGTAGKLRIGLAAYGGGLDNGNQGKNPGLEGSLALVAGDLQGSLAFLDFRGAIAHGNISGAREIGNGAASRIFGWSLEGAVRILPKAWKKGALSRAEVTCFFRVDRVNTQYDMPRGLARNRAAERLFWTAGLTVHLTPRFVIKGDVQKEEDRTGTDRDLQINLGVGWQF